MSVTLDKDNVLWLKAQATASAKGPVSDVLDRLVTRARADGHLEPAGIRSVAGTIDLPEDDPDLTAADVSLRGLFTHSLSRAMLVREKPPKRQAKRARRG